MGRVGGIPQNSTTLSQCSGNITCFQAIQRTTSVSSNEFKKQHPYIFFIILFVALIYKCQSDLQKCKALIKQIANNKIEEAEENQKSPANTKIEKAENQKSQPTKNQKPIQLFKTEDISGDEESIRSVKSDKAFTI